MNVWQRPDFVELCLNAEIGAYQEDTGEERDAPPLRRPAAAATETDAQIVEALEHVA